MRPLGYSEGRPAGSTNMLDDGILRLAYRPDEGVGRHDEAQIDVPLHHDFSRLALESGLLDVEHDVNVIADPMMGRDARHKDLLDRASLHVIRHIPSQLFSMLELLPLAPGVAEQT